MYSPSTVANYFLRRANAEGRALTPMQLLKLVYIAHGWHLGYFGQPLINETVQAWKYGPVIKSLYDNLRKYGGGPVTSLVATGPFAWQRDMDLSGDSQRLVDAVWENYSSFSGIQLSQMTHQVGTPWDIVWRVRGGSRQYFAEIDDGLIEAHYKGKISTNASATEKPATEEQASIA
ncbi:putative phage-associated protein [Luteimonas sp. J16]|uniref:Panacea domain-containing protein n=2 Tax=unclassified Luteimonas TaxID=2629088 RepID=UPI0011ADC22B|nr:type II toxin-antitoxin system antitoxin SocA domain-containing protein [Luteimonas sp. J16]TWG92220.1 putative phage-associated protein [Luteimonas sp. J16]